jgi:hypothetical protein
MEGGDRAHDRIDPRVERSSSRVKIQCCDAKDGLTIGATRLNFRLCDAQYMASLRTGTGMRDVTVSQTGDVVIGCRRRCKTVYALVTAQFMREMIVAGKGVVGFWVGALRAQGLHRSGLALDTARKAVVSVAVAERQERISA